MNKKGFVILAAIFLVAVSALGFLLFKHQAQIAKDFSSIFSGNNNLKIDLSSASKLLNSNGTSTQAEIDQLRKEVEYLKNQPPKIVYKSALTPASPAPAPDLKTQEALDSAQKRISSLEDQLQKFQTQSGQAPALGGDANLIQSWQASEKVVQIACQDKVAGDWQLGSGVLISSDGKVLTNQHVVQLSSGLAPDYCLALFNKDYDTNSQSFKREYRAVVTGSFSGRDAAQLKIQDVIFGDASGQIQNAPILNSFQFFNLAANQPQIGDATYVIGFPESAKFNFSVTKGIISNLVSNDVYFGTDAQIDRGNSGGAAVNSAGQLIGLPTYKYVGGGDYRGYILDIHSLNLN